MRFNIIVVIISFLIVSCTSESSKNPGSSPGEDLASHSSEPDPPVPFSELSSESKEQKITEKVLNYITENSGDIEFENYEFLMKYHNMLRPCPEDKYKIRVYQKSETVAETAIYLNQSYEFLKPDRKYGELDMYGISFSIDEKTGDVTGHFADCSFTKWSKGKIGARESKGSEFLSFEGKSTPDMRKKYGDEKLIDAVQRFFDGEMKAKQARNRHKCR